jgi:hypothetical protein
VDWTTTVERIAQMAAKVIPYELLSCPTKASDQQLLVIDIVARLCTAASPVTTEKDQRKHKRMKQLRQQCQNLLARVKEQKTLLDNQLRNARVNEEGPVVQKLAEFESLMAAHHAKQQGLIQVGRGPPRVPDGRAAEILAAMQGTHHEG